MPGLHPPISANSLTVRGSPKLSSASIRQRVRLATVLTTDFKEGTGCGQLACDAVEGVVIIVKIIPKPTKKVKHWGKDASDAHRQSI